MPRHPPTRRTPKRDAAFFAKLADGLSVGSACDAARYSRSSVYSRREFDHAFAAAWDQAVELGTDQLEDIAKTRAAAGSDVLTIFLLKARRPERFKDRAHVEHTGRAGGPIETIDYSDRDRAKGMAMLLAQAAREAEEEQKSVH